MNPDTDLLPLPHALSSAVEAATEALAGADRALEETQERKEMAEQVLASLATVRCINDMNGTSYKTHHGVGEEASARLAPLERCPDKDSL